MLVELVNHEQMYSHRLNKIKNQYRYKDTIYLIDNFCKKASLASFIGSLVAMFILIFFPAALDVASTFLVAGMFLIPAVLLSLTFLLNILINDYNTFIRDITDMVIDNFIAIHPNSVSYQDTNFQSNLQSLSQCLNNPLTLTEARNFSDVSLGVYDETRELFWSAEKTYKACQDLQHANAHVI